MNDFSDSESDYQTPAEQCARRNPGASLLVILGVGLIVGAIVHALRPNPRPQQRIARLLEDIEDSLREASAPTLKKAGTLAASGANAVGDRLHRGEAQVEKLLRTATRQLRRWTS